MLLVFLPHHWQVVPCPARGKEVSERGRKTQSEKKKERESEREREREREAEASELLLQVRE